MNKKKSYSFLYYVLPTIIGLFLGVAMYLDTENRMEDYAEFEKYSLKSNGAVEKEYRFEKVLGDFGDGHPTRLTSASDVVTEMKVDYIGDIYILVHRAVFRINSDGEYLPTFIPDPLDDYSRGIAIDSIGNIYVSLYYEGIIIKFNASKKYVATFGRKGINPGEFHYPTRMASDSKGNLYIVDYPDTARIQKFDKDGNFLGIVGEGFWDIQIDKNDKLYLADKSGIITKMSAESEIIFTLKSFRDDEYLSIENIFMDHDNNLYVLNNEDYLRKFDSDGNFVFDWGKYRGFKRIRALDFDKDGNLYILDQSILVKYRRI